MEPKSDRTKHARLRALLTKARVGAVTTAALATTLVILGGPKWPRTAGD